MSEIASSVTRAIGAQYDAFQASLEAAGMPRKYLNYGYWTSAAQSFEEASAQLCLELFRAAEIGPHDVLVDVGFGSGEQTLLLSATHEFDRLVGFNISAKQVRYAARRAAERGLSHKLEFRHGEAESLPGVADGSVDRLMAIECAFYFDRPRFYRRAAEVLKPGGRAVLADIMMSDWLSFLMRTREDFRRLGTRGGNRRLWEAHFVTRSICDMNRRTRIGVQKNVVEILRLAMFSRITWAQRRTWFKMAFYTQIVAIGQWLGWLHYDMIVLEKK